MTLEKNADELIKSYQVALQEKEFARMQAASKKPLALPAPEFEHKHGKPTKRMNNQEREKVQKEED